MEIVKTDVLVIGGGGAGMRAAMAARDKGAEVLLVSKTPLGKPHALICPAGVLRWRPKACPKNPTWR